MAQEGRAHHSDPNAQVEQIDGVESNLNKNIETRKQYIAQLRADLQEQSRKIHELQQRHGGNLGYSAD